MQFFPPINTWLALSISGVLHPQTQRTADQKQYFDTWLRVRSHNVGSVLLSSTILCRDLSISAFWCPQGVLEPPAIPRPHGCLRTNTLLESQSIWIFDSGQGWGGSWDPCPPRHSKVKCMFVFDL